MILGDEVDLAGDAAQLGGETGRDGVLLGLLSEGFEKFELLVRVVVGYLGIDRFLVVLLLHVVSQLLPLFLHRLVPLLPIREFINILCVLTISVQSSHKLLRNSLIDLNILPA